MKKQKISLKIPEMCQKSGSKHCDNTHGRVSFPFRLIHLKKSIEVSSSGRRTIIQEANELSSGEVLISLLSRNKSEKQKQNSRLRIQRIISSEKNAKIHSASNIFHIKHHSSLPKIPSSKPQPHCQVQPKILEKHFIMNKGTELSMQDSSCSSTNVQLWMAALIKIQFFYLALLNNLPMSISTLPLNRVIKMFMSKLILFLKSNNCASSIVSSLQSRYVGCSRMEFISSVLGTENDSLLTASPLNNEATTGISSILQKLASHSFEFFSALHFGMECVKPSCVKPCLIGSARVLSFTTISKTADARVRKLNIATIPILDASSNIVDLQVIVKQCSAVPFNRQRSKMLSKQKSSPVCSSKKLQQHYLNFKLNPFTYKKVQQKRKTLTNKIQHCLGEVSQMQNKNIIALPMQLFEQNSSSTKSSVNYDTFQKQILDNDKCLIPVNNGTEFLKNSNSHDQQAKFATLQNSNSFVRETVTLAFHAKILNSSLFGANTSQISGNFGNDPPRLEIASSQNETSDDELCPTFKIYQDCSLWIRTTENVKNCPEFPETNSQNVASKRTESNGNHFKAEICKSATRTRANEVVKFDVSSEKKFTHPKESSTISDNSIHHSLSNELATKIGSKEQLEVINLQVDSDIVSTGIKRKRSSSICNDIEMNDKVVCLHSEPHEEKLSYANINANLTSATISIKSFGISENAVNAKFSEDLHNHNRESQKLGPQSFESLENSKLYSESKLELNDQLSDVEPSFSEETDTVSVENKFKETNEKFINFETFSAKRIKVSKDSSSSVKSKCSNFVAEDVTEIQKLSSEVHDLGQQYSLNLRLDYKKNEKVLNLANVTSLNRDNLNDMPFVGFHTAAGKRISISESALKAAEHKFSNFAHDDVGENEKPLKNHESVQIDFLSSKPSLDDQSKNQGKLLQETDTVPIKDNVTEVPFISIQTASRKRMDISGETLTVVKRKFSDFACDVITGTELLLSSKSKSLPKVAINSSSKDEPRGKSQFTKQTNEISVENDLDSPPVTGFHATTETKISTPALSTAEGKFSDLMSNEIVKNQELSPKDSASSQKSLVNLESSFEDNVKLSMKIDPVPFKSNQTDLPFLDFQTASRKGINISDEALNAVKHKYCIADEMVNSELFSANLESLQNIPMNSKFIDHVEDDNFQRKTTDAASVITDLNEAPFIGFPTAAGKKTSISEETLNVVKENFSNFLPNDDMDVRTPSPKNPDCSSECLLSSKEHLGNRKELPEGNRMIFVENTNNAPFAGFKTASGKSIKVSKEALNAVGNKFFDYMPELLENEMSVLNSETVQQTMELQSSKLNSENITKEQLSMISNISSTEGNLDINAFSGFQAASSKHVKISEESLNVAKRKFSDPINYKNLDAIKPIRLNSTKNIPNQNGLLFSSSRNDLRQRAVTGFQTAAGKNVNVSDKALNAVKEKFADRFVNEHSETNEMENLVSFTSKYPESEQKSADYNCESLLCSNQPFVEKNIFVGFQTAAGKKINISDKALTLIERKFSNLLADETEDENRIVSPDIEHVQCESFSAIPSLINKQNAENKLQGSSSSSFAHNLNSGKFIGFQTAGGKSIDISEKALNDVKSKFLDFFSNEDLDCEKSPVNSESAETRREKECKSKVSGEIVSSHSKNAIGFQTAAGKKINISDKALTLSERKFSNLLADETEDENRIMSPNIGHVQCESFSAIPSLINKQNAENKLQGSSSSPVDHNLNSGKFIGFRTAGGKSIDISEKALNDVKSKFLDFFSNEDLDWEKSPVNSESAETRREKECKSKVSEETVSSHSKNAIGFQTAAGKNINISNKALTLIERKFSNLLADETEDENRITSPDIEHVQCESFSVIPSLINKQNAENKLQGSSSSSFAHNLNSGKFIGFQTAGGKSIDISEKALNDVKSKFLDFFSNEDLDCEKSPVNSESAETRREKECKSKVSEETVSSHSKNAIGFQTAAGKNINISNKALTLIERKFSNLLADETEDENRITSPDIEHVQCESFGAVPSPINKQNVENKLQGSSSSSFAHNLNSGKFMGFRTAGGKSIDISEKALNAVKSKFLDFFSNEDLDCEKSPVNSESAETRREKECKSKVSEETVSSHSKNAIGFQTAAGKNINISNKALTLIERKFSNLLADETEDENRIMSPDIEHVQCESFSAVPSPINKQNVENKLQGSSSSSFAHNLNSGKFIGFQTAGGKSIDISEKALNAVKSKFLDFFSNEDLDCEKSPVNSESAETRREKECKSKVSEETVSSHSKNAIGFQTAAGKNINISDKALTLIERKFSNLLADETEDENRIMSPDIEHVQCESFSAIPSPINKQNAENKLQGSSSSPVDHNLNSGKFIGFQTAGGKNITISEKALNDVKSKFLDFFSNEDWDCEKSPVNSESAETRREKECKSKVLEETVPSHSKNAIGFQTAAGKNVSVSQNALSAVKRKFGDLLNDEVQPIALDSFKKPCLSSNIETDLKRKRFCTKSDSCLLGTSSLEFQTAAGKDIKVSEEALNTVKRKFHGTLYNEKIEAESSPTDNVFMEKFQNLSSDFKIIPNEEVCSTLTNLTPGNSNKDENMVLIEKNDNTSRAVLNAAKGKLNCMQKKLNCNKTIEIQRSVTTDFRPATISKIRNQIKIIDFEGCKCFDYKNTEESIERRSSPSPNSNMNNFSTECSFICPHCFKPCEFANTIQLPKFSYLHPINGKMNEKVFSINVRKLPCQKSNYIPNVKIKLGSHPLNNKAHVAKCHVNILDQVKELRQQQTQSIATKRGVKIMPGQLTLLKQSTDHHKRIKLRNLTTESTPGCYSTNELLSYGMKQHTLDVNSESAKNFIFEENDFKGYPCINTYCFTVGDNAAVILNDSKCAGKEEFFSAFSDSPGVDPSLISDLWFYNHYRWIVWKLASLEFSFPSVCGKNSLTPHNVMLQMKFRYDSEIDSSKRSALKKIIERDDTPTKTLVLIISSISKRELEKPEQKNIGGDIYKVRVSDGWYEITAKIDSAMENLIKKNKINVGSKIITSGAELCGSDVACSPLEIPDSLQLKIHTNSTRISQWDVKLGYFRNPRPFPVSLSSIIPDGGGCIGHISVVVSRVYPILYMEKYENGHRITRNEKMELRIQAQHQKLQEHHLNRIRISSVKAFEERLEKKNSALRWKQSSHRSKLSCGEDLFNALNCAVDVQAFLESLDVQQISLLEEFEKTQMERKRFQIEAEINNAITEAKNAGEYPIDRNVTPVLKVLVKGSHKLDLRSDKDIVLNLWRPSSDILDLFTEGTAIGIYYLIPSRYQSNIIHLNSMKSTRYERISLEKTVVETVYEPRKVTEFSDISQQLSDSVVIDTIGFVYHVTESSESVMKSIDMLYLADVNYNSLVIKFPDGFASTGCQEFLTVGNVIAVCNLKLDSNPNEFPSSGVATLVTTFSCNPKATYLNKAMENLKKQIMNPVQFIKQAKTVLENELEGRSKKSKYRPTPNEHYYTNSAKRHKSDETDSSVINGQIWNSIDKVPNPKTPLLSECQPKKLFPSMEDRLLKLGSMPSPPPLRNLNFNASLSTRSHYRSPK